MIEALADWITYSLLGIARETTLGDAAQYFFFDSVKILLLLLGVIFIVSLIRTFIPPAKVREIVGGKREGVGNILAALLGMITPFCSCSAIPLFLGFIESGIPLGVTFSFLIASPMINEVAVILLLGLVGPWVTLLYVSAGLLVAIIGGVVIGRMNLEGEVSEFLRDPKYKDFGKWEFTGPRDRLETAVNATFLIIRRIFLFVLIGIAVGAFIHGFVPAEIITNYVGRENFFAVPIAVIIGIPLYANAGGVIPLVSALMAKGMSLGTALAFTMSVTALSLPEMIILSRVMKPKLLAIFIILLFVSFVLIGYAFNFIV